MTGPNIERIYGLSPLQEGILFHTLEQSRPGAYFEQYSCTLDQVVDAGRLERAWQAVAARHPVMRTLFTWDRRDKPLQIVRRSVSLPWQHLDWRVHSAQEQAHDWAQLLQRDRDRGFDLARAPLMRFTLVRIGESRSRLLWSFHHALVDGWTQRMLLAEAARLYQSDCREDMAQLPPPRAYEDFIRWLDSHDTDSAERFWTRKLSGLTAPTRLAASVGAPRERSSSTESGTSELTIAGDALARLKTFTRQQRLTLNTALVGAWALVLSRFTQRDDVIFGVTVAGRSIGLEGAGSIAGLMINTLPLRIDVPRDAPLPNWLRHVQSEQLAMHEFEQTPLSLVQRCSSLRGGRAMFDTIVVFENAPAAAIPDSGPNRLDFTGEHYAEFSHYPFAILAVPDDSLRLLAVYDPALFDAETADRLLAHLRTALESMPGCVDEPLGSVPIIPSVDVERQVRTWNDTAADLPDDACVHQLFEANARRRPDAPAISDADGQLSYSELNDRANRLAHALIAEGASAGSLVPLFIERSIDAIVAMLAVLKAGAAYVPIDPELPAERIRFLLDDVRDGMPADREPLLLTRQRLIPSLPDHRFRTVCVDAAFSNSPGSDADPNLAIATKQLAYVIYTSGSTGRPKGVMISHRALANSTLARSHYYPQVHTRFLLLSSLATDSSVVGVYWTLCTGSQLVLASPRLEQDIDALCALIAQRQVSCLLCVPSLYALMLEHADRSALSSLQAAIVAGEACPRELVQSHREALPAVALYNEYGPSEATVWASAARIDTADPRAPVSIGRPIANTRIYLLDAAMQPVPLGVAGEIHIGGTGLADGYLNSPAITAQRFVPDPFDDRPGARLYKTGDLARQMHDGDLEFIGRIDNQIKLRGYRIEPEEIETVLATHPAVREVVVVADAGQQAVDDDPVAPTADPRALALALSALNEAQSIRLLDEIEAMSPDDIERDVKILLSTGNAGKRG